jgi:hypothetical protein
MKKVALFSIIFGLFFFSCGGNDNVDKFVAKTNEETNNDVATLGFVGTTVLSDKLNVATAEITETAKIKITSVSGGIAIITVSDDSNRNATINISVSETGTISIEAIQKYIGSPYAGIWESNQYLARMVVDDILTFIQEGKNNANDPWENVAKGSLAISGTDITVTVTHKWMAGTSTWSNDPAEVESIKGYFGGSLVLTGTISGSTTGSIMLDHMVKQ